MQPLPHSFCLPTAPAMQCVDDPVSLDKRLSVRLAAADIEVLQDFVASRNDIWLDADAIAWDLRRHGIGNDAFEGFLISCGDDEYINDFFANDDADATGSYLCFRLAAFDRPHTPSDRLLIDVVDELRHDGFTPSAALAATIQSFEMIADTQREAIETKRQADFATLLAAERTTAESEKSAIDRAMRAICLNANSTDTECEAAEAQHDSATAAWHQRHDYLWPVDMLAQARQQLEQDRKTYFAKVEAVELARKNMPLPTRAPLSGGVPMLNTQQVVADLGATIVDAFLAAQSGRAAANAPRIPDAMHDHPLFEALNRSIAYLTGTVEAAPKAFRSAAAVELLAVLSAVHEPTYSTLCARIRGAGAALPDSKINVAVRRFESQVSRDVRTGAGWATDSKGMPDGANTDNVAVYLRMVGADVRLNDWSKRVEIKSAGSDTFEPFQERHFNSLLTTAANGQHNFRPRESMFKRAMASLASESTFDPVLDRIAAAQASWDGTSRLDSWLATATGATNDPYLRAVGRSLIGGIVKRARKPGAKHDEVVILVGPQDTLKSTLCRVLALNDEWFTDSVAFEGSPQNIVPQLFGKLVVELAELDGMARREVNYIKRFLSAQSDNVTLKYEAFASDHARRCVFVGSSNEENPLRDATGNRRFLPVRIDKKIDVDFVRENIDCLFGEAAALESAGELFLIPGDVLPEARARQEEARAESDFEIHIASWFSGDVGAAYILPADLAVLLKEATGRSVPPNAYGHAMRRLGFISSRPYMNDVRTRMWVRGAFEGARRYELHRDAKTGRACPKVMFPVVSTMPALPVGRR